VDRKAEAAREAMRARAVIACVAIGALYFGARIALTLVIGW
jgi:hypothetical protein